MLQLDPTPAGADARLRVLLVEDEQDIADPIETVLADEGYIVTVAGDGDRALTLLDNARYDLVITDIRLPTVDGLTVFRHARRECAAEVIIISAYGTVEQAVAAMKEQAADYLLKPFELDQLLLAVSGAAQRVQLARRQQHARRRLQSGVGDPIVGDSRVIRSLKQHITALADSDAAVLISGESGTGKELVARAIHARSARGSRPFIALNCAAFPETLIEAELFGYERGAFTGASGRREGRFRAADTGTLFLDEVAEMPLTSQAKLLRVLEEGTFSPLGSDRTLHSDVRILSATNVRLRDQIDAGRFREDLYYRLKVFELSVPPLRERRSDLPQLVEHFLDLMGDDRSPTSIAPDAWAAIMHYAFPGNVRELRHAIKHALVLSRDTQTIRVEHLPPELRDAESSDAAPSEQPPSLRTAIERFERQYLVRTLERTCGNRSEAARLLGISRKNLWEKMRRHGLGVDRR